jgi:DNA-binding transcriptional MerR regulator
VARVRHGSATKSAPLANRADDLFRDGKDAGALRTIGEVAKALGLRQHVLRYWEDQFPMLRPLTRAGGRRYYRPADIALVIDIDRLLHREGYTIRGALQALARPAVRRAPAPARDTSAPLLDAINHDPALSAIADQPPEQALLTALSVLRQHLEAIRNRLALELGKA